VAGVGQVIRPYTIREHNVQLLNTIAFTQLCNQTNLHHEEDKNQKAKTVNMKKGRKRGEGVWLGIVSGLGTPDRGLKLAIPFKWEEYFLDRVWGFSAAPGPASPGRGP
jgi:hypothetical protein